MNKLYWLSLIPLTVMALAQGGAFEPDNVVRVDTVTVVQHHTIPLRVDTVYQKTSPSYGYGCNTFHVNDGTEIRVQFVKVAKLFREFDPASAYEGIDGIVLSAYRTCNGEVIHLNKSEYIKGVIF